MNLHELHPYYEKEQIFINRRKVLHQDIFQQTNKKKSKKSSTPETHGIFKRIIFGIRDFFYLFMATSSIHGFSHVTKEKRHAIE